MKDDGPIVNLDSFDVVGVRKDGGLDLVISCTSDMDGSAETAARIEAKVQNYLREISEAKSPTLYERYGCSADADVRIIISCSFDIADSAMLAIDRMTSIARSYGVELVLRGSKELNAN